MPQTKTLDKFDVTGSGDTYTLHIADDDGTRFELKATRDQLDIIADTLDDILSADDTADEVDGVEEEEDEDDEVKSKAP